MFFGKKRTKETEKCDSCASKINKGYSYCPHCGVSFVNMKEQREDFGLLGKSDLPDNNPGNEFPLQGFGITDKLISTVFNSLMKNLDKQFKDQGIAPGKEIGKPAIKGFPAGINIKIFGPYENMPVQRPKQKSQFNSKISEQHLKKMSELPREKAKANVKRIGDKVIYELTASGINSVDDIFVAKVETGYEIKAIGQNKIYVNNIPINLPLRKYSIKENKLLFEFVAGHEF